MQGEAGGAEALPLTQVRPEARVAQGLQHRAADVCVGVCDAHAEQLREDVAHLVWRGAGRGTREVKHEGEGHSLGLG